MRWRIERWIVIWREIVGKGVSKAEEVDGIVIWREIVGKRI